MPCLIVKQRTDQAGKYTSDLGGVRLIPVTEATLNCAVGKRKERPEDHSHFREDVPEVPLARVAV